MKNQIFDTFWLNPNILTILLFINSKILTLKTNFCLGKTKKLILKENFDLKNQICDKFWPTPNL